MKMSSPERRRFEGRSFAQHRPQDIDATARQGDQGLGVPLALRSLAVVESPGGGCAAETSKGRLPEDPLEDLIPPTHPTVVAGTFAGVMGSRYEPGIGGESIGALKGSEVAGGHQELGSEDRPHSWQANEDRRLRAGEKTLPELLVEGSQTPFEFEDLSGELGDDGSGDLLGGQAHALRFGRGESFLGEPVGSFDAALFEVGGESFAAHPANGGGGLVAHHQGEIALVVEIQGALEGREQRKERLSEAGDGPALVGDEIASAGEQELHLGEFPFAGGKLRKITPHAGLVGDDVGVFGVGLGFAAVSVAGPVDGEAGDVEDPLVALPQQRQEQRRTASGLVDGPSESASPGEGEDLLDEPEEVCLVVLDPSGEKLHAGGVHHVRPVELLAGFDALPSLVHEDLPSFVLHEPSECPADGSLRSECLTTSPISISGRDPPQKEPRGDSFEAICCGGGKTAIPGSLSVIQIMHPNNTNNSREEQSEEGAANTSGLRHWFSGWSVSIAMLGALAFCFTLAEGAGLNWSAVYVADALGGTEALGAIGLGVFLGAVTIGRLVGDTLVSRLGPIRVFRAGAVMAGVGFGGALLVDAPVAGLVGLALLGAGIANALPLAIAAGGNIPGQTPATAAARVSTLGYMGSFVGPVLVGSLASLYSLPVALGLPALFVLAAALGAGAVRRAG